MNVIKVQGALSLGSFVVMEIATLIVFLVFICLKCQVSTSKGSWETVEFSQEYVVNIWC